jgi:hypothetical protein
MSKPSLSALATTCLIFGLLAGCAGDSEQQLIASARAYLAKRELSAAAIELKRALDKNGRSEEARMLLGKVLLEDGDPAAAEVELRRPMSWPRTRIVLHPTSHAPCCWWGRPARWWSCLRRCRCVTPPRTPS